MVKVRLRRMGVKKKPFYRVIVADSRAPRNGKFIEELGTYNPLSLTNKLNVNIIRLNEWIKNGAQPTDIVKSLIKKINS